MSTAASSLSRFLTVLCDLTYLRHIALDFLDFTATQSDLGIARRVINIISKCKIHELSLQGASERNLHLSHILRSLRDNRFITKLDLSESMITDQLFQELKEILPTTGLITLGLRAMPRLPEMFIASFRNILALREVDFSGSDFAEHREDGIFARLCSHLATQPTYSYESGRALWLWCVLKWPETPISAGHVAACLL